MVLASFGYRSLHSILGGLETIASIALAASDACLHSILGGLETSLASCSACAFAGLHSILGGLETDSWIRRSLAARTFTFHFGWIRNRVEEYTLAHSLQFTFHFGWIRNDFSGFDFDFGISLHSILGGLETFWTVTYVEIGMEFTFHFGWIRNTIRSISAATVTLFTFHFGWIRNGSESFFYAHYYAVYIPFWVD